MQTRDPFGLVLALEVIPAGLFAASVGFAVRTAAVQPLAFAAIAGLAAFVTALLGLRRLRGVETPVELPHFDVDPIEPEGAARAANREASQEPPAGDVSELLLEDVLGGLAPDSRVVSLFQAVEAPTAGELHGRIERHLGAGTRASAPPDATRELHEALAALRSSLR
jgi:hypothetical protein